MENNKIKCLFCQSDKVRKIRYGLFQFKDEEDERKFKEKYVMGGCQIYDDSPAFHCDNCRKDFGKLKDLKEEK